MLDDLVGAVQGLFLLLIICMPLGVWKLVEIIIWLYQHVRFNLV